MIDPANRCGKAEDIAAWKESLRGVLAVTRKYDLRVLVIAPVPTYRFPVPECLAHLTAERCGVGRMARDQTRGPLVADLREIVAEFDNAQLWDPINPFCNDTVCTPVHDGMILYSDWSHLSLLGSRALAPYAAPYLDWLIH
jgi:SGNH domain (fused to AT3 domains)